MITIAAWTSICHLRRKKNKKGKRIKKKEK